MGVDDLIPSKRYDRSNRTTVEWTTPKAIIDALGPFDLDPCTHAGGMPWRTAARMLTPKDDGLTSPWAPDALVWMNPPYGAGQDQWMRKLAEHGHGIALVLSRTDTQWFHSYVFQHPSVHAVLFSRGRIQFCDTAGTQLKGCPVGAVFVAYGALAADRLNAAFQSGAIDGAHLVYARPHLIAAPNSAAAND